MNCLKEYKPLPQECQAETLISILPQSLCPSHNLQDLLGNSRLACSVVGELQLFQQLSGIFRGLRAPAVFGHLGNTTNP